MVEVDIDCALIVQDPWRFSVTSSCLTKTIVYCKMVPCHTFLWDESKQAVYMFSLMHKMDSILVWTTIKLPMDIQYPQGVFTLRCKLL